MLVMGGVDEANKFYPRHTTQTTTQQPKSWTKQQQCRQTVIGAMRTMDSRVKYDFKWLRNGHLSTAHLLFMFKALSPWWSFLYHRDICSFGNMKEKSNRCTSAQEECKDVHSVTVPIAPVHTRSPPRGLQWHHPTWHQTGLFHKRVIIMKQPHSDTHTKE